MHQHVFWYSSLIEPGGYNCSSRFLWYRLILNEKDCVAGFWCRGYIQSSSSRPIGRRGLNFGRQQIWISQRHKHSNIPAPPKFEYPSATFFLLQHIYTVISFFGHRRYNLDIYRTYQIISYSITCHWSLFISSIFEYPTATNISIWNITQEPSESIQIGTPSSLQLNVAHINSGNPHISRRKQTKHIL